MAPKKRRELTCTCVCWDASRYLAMVDVATLSYVESSGRLLLWPGSLAGGLDLMPLRLGNMTFKFPRFVTTCHHSCSNGINGFTGTTPATTAQLRGGSSALMSASFWVTSAGLKCRASRIESIILAWNIWNVGQTNHCPTLFRSKRCGAGLGTLRSVRQWSATVLRTHSPRCGVETQGRGPGPEGWTLRPLKTLELLGDSFKWATDNLPVVMTRWTLFDRKGLQ
jgi:hypothetical protein